MVNIIGGYKSSSGNLGIKSFSSSPNLVKLAGASISDEYRIPEYTPLSDQGKLSSCVANATADAFEILKGLEDPTSVKQLSRLFLYWNARAYTNDTGKDQGTFIHNALDSLTRLGICEESAWPYNTSSVYAQPPILAYKEGNDNTINTFYQITTQNEDRLKDIELAIRANHPVIFGTSVGAEFESYTGGDKVFDLPETSLGGHALLVVGVRRNPDVQFLIRNSWGPSWGENGHAWFSANYMMASATNDLFVPTRMDNLLV